MAADLFFFLPGTRFIIFALLSLSLPLIVTQIQGHVAGPPPPSPLRYNNAFILIGRRIELFFSPRQLAYNCTAADCTAAERMAG